MSTSVSVAAQSAAVFAIVQLEQFHEPRTDANVRVHSVVRDATRAAREVERLNRAHAGRGTVFLWTATRLE